MPVQRPLPRARAVACGLLVASSAAWGHATSVSTSEIRVDGTSVVGEFQFARVDVAPLLGSGGVDVLARQLLGAIQVSADGAPCPAEGGFQLAPAGDDGLQGVARWRCRAPPLRLSVQLGFLPSMPTGHTHLSRLSVAGQVVERMGRAGSPTLEAEARPTPWSVGVRFLRLGVEHIFTGYDHIAFLIGLLLLGGKLLDLFRIVTSFTLAHSVTLALATLGWVVPPPRIIEPLIAASIVAVALENLWALRSPVGRAERVQSAIAHRWRITFAFGLVHGFGFATALRELHLPRASVAASLVSFNLGVEMGQVCIVALALPLLRWLRSWKPFWPRGVAGASWAIAALGVFWIAQRVAGG